MEKAEERMLPMRSLDLAKKSPKKAKILRIRQILTNFLNNSVKFTEKGYIKFKIWSEPFSPGRVRIRVDVEDSGIGIRKEDINKIFGSFSQVDTHRNRDKQGTGLGLAISRELVRLMGGDIVVDSVYGQGSTFHISFIQRLINSDKLGEEVARSIENEVFQQKVAQDEYTIVPHPDKKVLIVDDAKVNLMVAKGLMKPYQFQIDTAMSGHEAIEMVQKTDYDIVFMDHMMPELDGVETTHMIRELGDTKYVDLIVVALTADAVEGSREMLIGEGMQDYISKPINKKQLNDVIEKWIG